MVSLYLIRHGEAEGNLYRRMHGQYDSALTDLGWRQIDALAERFRDVHLDGVYSSDLCRAMHTGAALCRTHGLPLYVDRRLREVSIGPWEDRSFGTVWADDPVEMEHFTHNPPAWRLAGADTYESLSLRASQALLEILEKHPGGTVAVCGHGCMINALLSRLIDGMDHPERITGSTNTAVTHLLYENGRFTEDYRHDRRHLTGSLLNLPTRRDLCFRPMAEDAVEEYIRYRKDAWQVVYGDLRGFDGSGFWLDAQRTRGPDPYAMVVGYLQGDPVGMVQLSPDREKHKGVGYIPFFYLREKYRHQGLGVQFLGHAVSFYRKLGRQKLQLSVAPTNEKALGFYHKYGFSQQKKQRGFHGSLLLMEKDISMPRPPADIPVRDITPRGGVF